jgi:hypothetical protein
MSLFRQLSGPSSEKATTAFPPEMLAEDFGIFNDSDDKYVITGVHQFPCDKDKSWKQQVVFNADL